jgi:hypothetical protein
MTTRVVWHRIESAPEGRPVLTKIDDEHGVRNEAVLTRRGSMWWIANADGLRFYVYYAPTHWAEP